MIQPPFEASPRLTAVGGVRHGFFGRKCGRSAGPLQGLNVSENNGDDPDRVGENRHLAMIAIGGGSLPLASLSQKHTNEVITIKDVPEPGARPVADGIVTALGGLALGIITADCAPILLYDSQARIIGALHAGWRGAVGGILENGVAAMGALGAEPGQIIAAIGPSISGANYEVGPEMAATLIESDPDTEPYIFLVQGSDRAHFDLPQYVEKRLARAGVTLVDRVGGCTYKHSGRYYSHRFATHRGTEAGRQISIIAMA